jgi:hypothetical protein
MMTLKAAYPLLTRQLTRSRLGLAIPSDFFSAGAMSFDPDTGMY